MAFIDLFIGCCVLPMRFVSAYGNPFTSKLCAGLAIGESFALASIIYLISFMMLIRIYDLRKSSNYIKRRYLILIILLLWLILFLFYGIPFLTNYSNYFTNIPSSSNETSYCITYIKSIYHPPWMAYTEIVIIYSIPLLCICTSLVFLLNNF